MMVQYEAFPFNATFSKTFEETTGRVSMCNVSIYFTWVEIYSNRKHSVPFDMTSKSTIVLFNGYVLTHTNNEQLYVINKH